MDRLRGQQQAPATHLRSKGFRLAPRHHGHHQQRLALIVDLHQWLGGIGGIGRSLARLFGALQPPVEADGASAASVECALFEDEHLSAKQAARGLAAFSSTTLK